MKRKSSYSSGSGINVCLKYVMILCLYLVNVGGVVHAFEFVPTKLEFEAWPYKCKAIYAGTTIGKQIPFTNVIPSRKIYEWRKYAESHGGAWHYCAGLVHLSRARLQYTPKEKRKHYSRAMSEVSFTYGKIKKETSWASEVGIALAESHYGLGERDKAIAILESIIRFTPAYAQAYFLSAKIFREDKDLKSAKKILLTGNLNTEQKSADILYMLGIISLEMNDIKEARKYAKMAYDLGYPLSYLKIKLKEYK